MKEFELWLHNMMRLSIWLFFLVLSAVPVNSGVAAKAFSNSLSHGTAQSAPVEQRGTEQFPLVVKIISDPKVDSSHAWNSNFVLPVEVGLVIAIVSYFISYLETTYRVGRGSHTLWFALASEIKFCSEIADLNIKDNLKSLSYRLPTSAYDNLFPKLVENNAINSSEISHLQKFYTAVNSINRSLEAASDHVSLNQNLLLDQEQDRILKRLKRIASKDGDYSVPLQKILKNRNALVS